MPEGCLMGSGAEASEVPLLHVSICSAVDTSMGCSTELLGGNSDGQPVNKGPRGQQSAPTNFTGLWERDHVTIIPLLLRRSSAELEGRSHLSLTRSMYKDIKYKEAGGKLLWNL